MALSKGTPAGAEPYSINVSDDVRHMDDVLIREAGFRIAARPPDGPAVWQKDGRNYTQQEAYRVAVKKSREKAQLRGGK